MYLQIIQEHKEPVRRIWHGLIITLAAIVFYLVDDFGLGCLIGVSAIFITFDWGRAKKTFWMMRIIDIATFGILLQIIREKEKDHFSTSTHFILAGFIMIALHLLFGLPKELMISATLFLAIGDPMAALIGREWKGNGFNGIVSPALRKKRLYGKKTLVGTLSFFCFGLLAVGLFCFFSQMTVSWPILFWGAFIATLVELRATDWDNFFVPLVSVLAMWILV